MVAGNEMQRFKPSKQQNKRLNLAKIIVFFVTLYMQNRISIQTMKETTLNEQIGIIITRYIFFSYHHGHHGSVMYGGISDF